MEGFVANVLADGRRSLTRLDGEEVMFCVTKRCCEGVWY